MCTCVCVWGGGMNDSFSSTYHPFKWNCAVACLLCLASFTRYNVSESHLACMLAKLSRFVCLLVFSFSFKVRFIEVIVSTVNFTLFSFDKYIYLCNHHQNQDIDYFHLPQKFPVNNLLCLPPVKDQWGGGSDEVESHLIAVNLLIYSTFRMTSMIYTPTSFCLCEWYTKDCHQRENRWHVSSPVGYCTVPHPGMVVPQDEPE